MITWLVIAVVILWCVVIALSLTVFALTRQIGVLYERVAPAGALMVNQALNVGDTAPEIKVEALTGEEIDIGIKDQATLLFFVAPDCPICKSLLPVFRSLSHTETDFNFILASDGDTPRSSPPGSRIRIGFRITCFGTTAWAENTYSTPR